MGAQGVLRVVRGKCRRARARLFRLRESVVAEEKRENREKVICATGQLGFGTTGLGGMGAVEEWKVTVLYF